MYRNGPGILDGLFGYTLSRTALSKDFCYIYILQPQWLSRR